MPDDLEMMLVPNVGLYFSWEMWY